jgi:hypothetical protein
VELLDRLLRGQTSEHKTWWNWKQLLLQGGIKDLGHKRRPFVIKHLMRLEKRAAMKERRERELCPDTINCGPLPKYPPGMTAESRKFGLDGRYASR